MELRDLEIFVAVAEESSVTRASVRLGMTQPGVSQHLARLEGEVGGNLLDRVGRRVELNDRGRTFLGRARKLLDDAAALIGAEAGGACPVGTLKLGLTDSSTLTVVPKALAEFRKRYPGIKIAMDVHDSSEIEHGILRGYYDLGVITQGFKEHPWLDEEVLYYDRIDALVAKEHPLARRRKISLKDLAEWPLLIYPRRSRTRHIIDDGFYSQRMVPHEIIEVYFNSAAVQLAEAGLGVALLSQAFIKNEVPKRKCVHLRIIGDPFTRAISLIRRRDAELSEAALSFYDGLKRA